MFFQKFMENFLHFPVTGYDNDYLAAAGVDQQNDMAVDRW